ncbi:MAG: hypothetical protein ABIQ98_04760 [Sphingomicrobium sp.]
MSPWREDLAAYWRQPHIRQAVVAWIANPGFALACHYRIAHWAVGRGRVGRGLALLIERRMIARFGCHLSARATIGPGVRFPHPVGIVIGERSVVGRGATIYHGVTLGRRRADGGDYPRLGDGVTLYCGATLLGAVVLVDRTVIGAGRLVIGDAAESEA